MKTLYLTDLDGTLLTSEAILTDFTKEKLNLLYENGVNVSAATARTSATVSGMFSGVKVSVPAILMNGAVMYDITESRYVRTKTFADNARRELLKCVSGTSGFIYTVDNGRLHTYYERNDTPHSVKFREERERKFGKVFTKVSSFDECFSLGCVYFSTAGEQTELQPLYDKLTSIEGLHIEFYRDIYNESFFYLEVLTEGVSKFAAANELREMYGFDRIIGFGDNLNDLPLFDACDESYAVSNAKEDVKKRANGIIGSNNEDGVVKYILHREGME